MAEKKKKGSIFWKIFALWLVVLAVVCLLLLNYGKKVMADYDETQKYPLENAKEIAAVLESGDYTMLFVGDDLHNSMTIEKEEYVRRIAEAVEKNGGCDVNKGFSYDANENPTFIISAGEKKIATVVYRRIEEKSKYGFDKYEFKSITPFVEGSYGVKALVPDDCDFILDELVMPEKYKTGETVTRTVPADDIEKNGEETFSYYYVDQLMEEPKFRIVYKDTGRDADMIWDEDLGVWTTRKYETAATAPSNYKVFVNGVEISADKRFVTKNDTPVEEIESVKGYTDKDVTMVSYHISGLRYKDEAEVTFRDFEGTEFKPEFSEKKEEYYCEAGMTPKDITAYGIDEDFLLTRAIGYATFVMNDAAYEKSIKQYLLKDSQAYNDLSSFWVTFSAHKSYWLENKKVYDVVFFHEGLFRATVSFDYWIRGYNHKTDNEAVYPTVITFWYANVGGTWYIVDWAVSDG